MRKWPFSSRRRNAISHVHHKICYQQQNSTLSALDHFESTTWKREGHSSTTWRIILTMYVWLLVPNSLFNCWDYLRRSDVYMTYVLISFVQTQWNHLTSFGIEWDNLITCATQPNGYIRWYRFWNRTQSHTCTNKDCKMNPGEVTYVPICRWAIFKRAELSLQVPKSSYLTTPESKSPLLAFTSMLPCNWTIGCTHAYIPAHATPLPWPNANSESETRTWANQKPRPTI